MEYALTLKDVTKKYEDFTLDSIDIMLPAGCIMGIIGENGAGKSTTIKLILDLIHRDGGTITVLGQDNRKGLESVKENIGVVLDESCFPENLNIRDIHLIMKNIYATWNEEVFFSYCKRFSLPEGKMIKDYSRGMKMKLAITAALSHDSKLLILDEATSGLDPIVRDEILEVFRDFIQDETHSIFMSSHIVTDLEKVCDFITFIHKGKIVFSQTTDSLIENYGILKCSLSDFEKLDHPSIKGYRKGSYGVEALVLRGQIPGNHVVDRATIEDIMLYHIKENVQ